MVELIVVIVILGIVSAAALPKFIDLSSEARAAQLKAGGAAILGAVSLVSAKALATGLTNDGLIHNVDIGGGQSVETVGIYPSCSSNGIWKAIDGLSPQQYYWTAGGSGALYCTIYPADNGTKHSDNCGVVYDVNAAGLWTPLTSGC